MAPVCSQCGGTDIELDAARGDAVCIQCGTVLEENAIVNEVTFAQDSGGGSTVVGQFVSATPGIRSAGLGFAKESREVAFSNGQRHISQLAAALRLADHHQEAAQRLFMLAVQHNFIQGRKTQHVIAACLYTVCRREKTAHLLIDYSDVLQTNVYMLGSCFLKFTRMLSLTLPVIDPSLYIHRFASRLEFGDKTHLVSMSALRLVQRMKRDWIQTGRRPSGICGAALLIAARVHGFRRTQREVIGVVRICDVTLRKRLIEFSGTSLGRLTARQLETVDLDTYGPMADPPSFTANRLADAAQTRMLMEPTREVERQRRHAELRSLKLPELRARLKEAGEPTGGRKLDLLERLLELDAEAEEREDAERASERSAAAGELTVTDEPEATPSTALVPAVVPVGRRVTFAVGTADSDGPRRADAETAAVVREMEEVLSTELVLRPGSGECDSQDTEDGTRPYPTAWEVADNNPVRAGDDLDEEEQQALMDELNADLDSLDAELEAYLIRDDEEVAEKARVWEELNKEYLDKQAARQATLEQLALARGVDVATAEALLEAEKRRPKRRRTANSGAEGGSGTAATAAEAVEAELRRNKQLSSRINYDVVSLLARTATEDAPSMPGGGPITSPSGADAEKYSDTHSVGDHSAFSDYSEPNY